MLKNFFKSLISYLDGHHSGVSIIYSMKPHYSIVMTGMSRK